jgi:hypothetical protein
MRRARGDRRGAKRRENRHVAPHTGGNRHSNAPVGPRLPAAQRAAAEASLQEGMQTARQRAALAHGQAGDVQPEEPVEHTHKQSRRDAIVPRERAAAPRSATLHAEW